MAIAGQKPGPGTYTCTLCGYQVTLKSADEKLPQCPKCLASTYRP